MPSARHFSRRWSFSRGPIRSEGFWQAGLFERVVSPMAGLYEAVHHKTLHADRALPNLVIAFPLADQRAPVFAEYRLNPRRELSAIRRRGVHTLAARRRWRTRHRHYRPLT